MSDRVRDRLMLFLDPNRSAGLFIVGTAALTVVITVLYDSVKESFGLLGAWILAAILLALAVAVITVLSLRKRAAGQVIVTEGLKPRPRAGLIVLVSASKATAPRAIEYHLEAGSLRVCWLIATTESLETARALATTYGPRLEGVYWGKDYLVDPDRVEDTYSLVTRIFSREVRRHGLPVGEVIADITGGMKPMTAGTALACLAHNRDMQYMKAVRRADGEPRRDVPTKPVRIDTTFLPAQVSASELQTG
jgi:hypothetical protein